MQNNEDQLFDWIEWKELCDIQKCNKEVADRLELIAQGYVKKNIYKISYQIYKPEDILGNDFGRALYDRLAFSYFENYAITHTYKRNPSHAYFGKRYKDAIFLEASKGSTPLGIIKKNFYKIFKTSLIQILHVPNTKRNMDSVKNEKGKKTFFENQSLNQKILDKSGNEIEIINMIESNEVVSSDNTHHEYVKEIAKSLIPDLMEIISFEHKALILCEALEIPRTSSPALQQVTGIASSSTLGDKWKRDIQGIFKSSFNIKNLKYFKLFKEKFPNENEESLLYLYKITLGIIIEFYIIPWGKSESRCLPLFKEASNK